MSNSMYSNIDSDDIFASAMEEAEIVENPFVEGDGEPLDALDAAKRLLGDDDGYGGDDGNFAFASNDNNNVNVNVNSNSNANYGGNSLLERIKQQKKQQTEHPSASSSSMQPTQQNQFSNTNTFTNTNTNTSTSHSNTMNTNTESQFGYPMVEDGTFSTDNGNQSNIRIPEYSQVPMPNPYNTDSPYINQNPSSSSSSSSSSDYKAQMMNVLSTVGSAANVVAKSAYQGSKTLYSKMTHNQSNSNTGLAGGGGGNMAQMDYQRESLLMDPHDLEERANNAPGTNSTSSSFQTSTASPSGMRAGVIRHDDSDGNSIMSYVVTFCVDMKDLFLGASRRVQIGVVALFVLIVYLLFFE